MHKISRIQHFQFLLSNRFCAITVIAKSVIAAYQCIIQMASSGKRSVLGIHLFSQCATVKCECVSAQTYVIWERVME